ncbi:tail protein [Arthrobacter phage Adaia]|uniref:Minor tail protein n=1 Tax=Arthrobacter phage Adaia TaxID=2419945 RepID=A0A3G2KCR0_9CAUD|nr:tail protein [Arthrobacter phage Adaia]AYN56802.1 minor tail protein [Arthrobacter phage Adaia]
MTTAQQFGYALPAGTDLIKYGDDAITQNANKSAELFTRAFAGDFTPQPIPVGADLNKLGDGFWYARTASQSASVLNKPAGQTDNPFEVEIRTSNEGSFKYQVQEYSGYSGARAGYWKRNTSNATGSAFLPWARLDNELVSSTGLAGIANMLRVQEFKDAIGPITTNGRAAVAFRWDHGLANFNASIRPLLEARNFKYALALSSRNFNAGENAGVTPATVNGWTLAEVWNHGANSHQDESSVAGLTDQIVTGLTELQAALPAKKIWGYMVPGTGGTGQGGFGGGANPEAFYKTLAGDLILTNHAVSSGSFPGTARRPLDGEVRQGMAHFTMEAQTVARIKLEVDNAIATRTGLQLMMHPSLLNGSGYLTTAQLTEVLDYIKAKQDSGDIVVLSPYEMTVADASPEKSVLTRNITNLWDGGAGGGTVTLTRTGNMVELSVYGSTATAEIIKLNPLPAGFRPPTNRIFGDPFYGSSSAAERALIYSTGRIDVFSTTEGANIYGALSWPTKDPWPTVLPGTPA